MVIRNPRLPRSVRKLALTGMRVGHSLVNLGFRRVGSHCHVEKLDVAGGPLKVSIEVD
jgi:hypothetical protein